MIFEALNAAADKGELLLVDHGLCHFHKREDGSVTIREIIVLPFFRGKRLGRWLVGQVQYLTGCTIMTARCPVDLPSNTFWQALGFMLIETAQTKTGRGINTWRLMGLLKSASAGVKPEIHARLPLPLLTAGGTGPDPTTPFTQPAPTDP